MTVLAVILVTLRLELAPDRSDSYPNRPITLVIPFAPGGESDFFGREIQKAIRDHDLLPVEIVVQNVQGAGATIGSGRVRRAAPDGYTMLLLHEALITAQSSGKVPYGPEAFEPIAATGKLNMVIAVREDSPFQTLGELMEEAADRPDELVFAANLNAPVHYAGLILESNQPGAAFLYTQIGGGSHRFESLVGGHADVSAFSMGEFIAYRAGGIRALAVSSTERHPDAPEIMTTVEQGYDFVHANMHFWWFPRGTDQARIDTIADVIEKAMATRQVHEALAARLCEPLVKTGQEMKSQLQDRISAIRSVDATSPNVMPNIPLWISLATLLSLVLAVWSHRSQTAGGNTENPTGEEIRSGYFPQVLLFSTLTLAYLACLGLLEVDFRIPTVLFMVAMVYLVRRREPTISLWRGFPWDLCILVPLLVHLVFQVFLQVDLP
ncbi:MAG: tripartite tricarboxylate transporter substrate-binding protein [Pirellulaceae bacterium]|nr:tripartite tricarboxylate transporter substrate-binding protein [Pirellulaceae bacterium]